MSFRNDTVIYMSISCKSTTNNNCKTAKDALITGHLFQFAYFFFSLLRLSLMIFISFAVISVQLFSLAHATHPLKTVGRNTLGTFRIISRASSVNLTVSSILSAAYLTEDKVCFLIGSSSVIACSYTIDYSVIILFFHKDLVNTKDEVCTILRSYSIEIVIRTFITIRI